MKLRGFSSVCLMARNSSTWERKVSASRSLRLRRSACGSSPSATFASIFLACVRACSAPSTAADPRNASGTPGSPILYDPALEQLASGATPQPESEAGHCVIEHDQVVLAV